MNQLQKQAKTKVINGAIAEINLIRFFTVDKGVAFDLGISVPKGTLKDNVKKSWALMVAKGNSNKAEIIEAANEKKARKVAIDRVTKHKNPNILCTIGDAVGQLETGEIVYRLRTGFVWVSKVTVVEGDTDETKKDLEPVEEDVSLAADLIEGFEDHLNNLVDQDIWFEDTTSIEEEEELEKKSGETLAGDSIQDHEEPMAERVVSVDKGGERQPGESVDACVSRKVAILIREGKPVNMAVAIAHSSLPL